MIRYEIKKDYSGLNVLLDNKKVGEIVAVFGRTGYADLSGFLYIPRGQKQYIKGHLNEVKTTLEQVKKQIEGK